MKNVFTILFLLYLAPVFSQIQNTTLLGHLPYPFPLNDVWGYTAPDGTMYALVGTKQGVSIVSLADPTQPKEVHFISGEISTWRDLRTWQHYCYVVADQSGTREGILIIDLSGLPDQVSFVRRQIHLPALGDTIFTSHNIWIDEQGFAYLSGANVNNGGVVILDLKPDPINPTYVGKGPAVYAHDCFARGNRLYTAEIYAGQFSIFDISTRSNPVLLASQETPFRFSHNVWPSDDGNFLYNTDERANAPVSAFDISNPNDIRLIDAFTPPATRSTGVIPHNVHVRGHFLVISHYTDGCVIVDASHPDHLVQVGWYDTSTDYANGFHGAWGAYPFFPSGLVLVSDIERGLFVLQPTYVEACRLAGTVTDALTGMPIPEARVSILSSDPNSAFTDQLGRYKTGQPTAGVFMVKVSALGYFDTLLPANLANGQLTTLDVALQPWPNRHLSGTVRHAFSGQPVPGVIVSAESKDFHYLDTTDASGSFSMFVKKGLYDVYVGRWGYTAANAMDIDLEQNDAQLSFSLLEGYEDPFDVDLGWKVTPGATDGNWERGKPRGTRSGDNWLNPPADSPNDPGPYAWVSGNNGFTFNDDDVDGGPTVLTSPPMALASCYQRPMLSYETWFFEPTNGFPANDTLVVMLDNGQQRVVLEMIRDNVQQWRPSPLFDVASLLPLTDQMRLILSASDFNPEFDFLEVGLDNFRVLEANGVPACHPDEDLLVVAWPNPFSDFLWLRFLTTSALPRFEVQVFNVLGQQVTGRIRSESTAYDELRLDWNDLPPGMYVIRLVVDDKVRRSVKVLKQ